MMEEAACCSEAQPRLSEVSELLATIVDSMPQRDKVRDLRNPTSGSTAVMPCCTTVSVLLSTPIMMACNKTPCMVLPAMSFSAPLVNSLF